MRKTEAHKRNLRQSKARVSGQRRYDKPQLREIVAQRDMARRAGRWALDLVTDWVPTDRYAHDEYRTAYRVLKGREAAPFAA